MTNQPNQDDQEDQDDSYAFKALDLGHFYRTGERRYKKFYRDYDHDPIYVEGKKQPESLEKLSELPEIPDTERKKELLEQVRIFKIQGYTNDQIAARMTKKEGDEIYLATVKNLVHKLYKNKWLEKWMLKKG